MLHYLNRIFCAGGGNDLYQDLLIIQEQANITGTSSCSKVKREKARNRILYVTCSEVRKYNTQRKDSEELPANSCSPPGTAVGLRPVPRLAWWERRGTDTSEG